MSVKQWSKLLVVGIVGIMGCKGRVQTKAQLKAVTTTSSCLSQKMFTSDGGKFIVLNGAEANFINMSSNYVTESAGLVGNKNKLTCAEFSPDNSKILFQVLQESNSKPYGLLFFREQKQSRSIFDNLPMASSSFSPNGQAVLSMFGTSSNLTASISNSALNNTNPPMPLPAVKNLVTDVSGLFSGDWLVWPTDKSSQARLWKVSMDAIQQDTQRIIGEENGSNISLLRYSPNSTVPRIVLLDPNGRAQLWDAGASKKIRDINGTDIVEIEFSPNGQYIAATSMGNTRQINVWDTETGELKVSAPSASVQHITSGIFSPDSTKVLIPNGPAVQGIDVKTGEYLFLLEDPELKSPVQQVVYSPDGQTVLARLNDSTLWGWTVK